MKRSDKGSLVSRRVGPRLLFLVLLFTLHTEALPCECVGGAVSGQGGLPAYAAVFLGTVTNLKLLTADEPVGGNELTSGGQVEVTFVVRRAWKGVNQQTVSVLTAAQAPACGYPFQVGQHYLVYARVPADGHGLESGLCTPTKELSQAGEDMASLGVPAYQTGAPTALPGGGSQEADEDPNHQRSGELGTISSGASQEASHDQPGALLPDAPSGCTKFDVPFSGRVVTRAAQSGKRPVAGARFSVVSDEPSLSAHVEVGPDGAFSGTVGVCDEDYYIKSRAEREQRSYRPGYTYVQIEADGCKTKVIKVDRRWKPKDIVLDFR